MVYCNVLKYASDSLNDFGHMRRLFIYTYHGNPANVHNDRTYSSAGKKAQIPTSRLVGEREHFSRRVMMSVAVAYRRRPKRMSCSSTQAPKWIVIIRVGIKVMDGPRTSPVAKHNVRSQQMDAATRWRRAIAYCVEHYRVPAV